MREPSSSAGTHVRQEAGRQVLSGIRVVSDGRPGVPQKFPRRADQSAAQLPASTLTRVAPPIATATAGKAQTTAQVSLPQKLQCSTVI